MRNLIYGLLLAPLTIINAADNPLRDADFSGVGRADSAWQLVADKDGKVEPSQAADGKTPTLHVKAAVLTQRVTLMDGLFELTVEGKGQGELILGVSGAGERTQMLGKDWGTYGYLFQSDASERSVTIHIPVDGTLTGVAIHPATDEQKAAWALEQKSMVQFGFITVSAQRPSPGSAPLQFTGNVKPLDAMTRFAVLDEPRLNTSSAGHVDRLVQWLGDNGFERLDGLKLPAWMAGRIKSGDAYGSVVVLPRGVSPAQLFDGPDDNKPLWLEYIRSGGRIVHVGNVPLGIVESPVVKPVAVDTNLRGVGILGLQHNWNSPYCGQAGLPVTPTAAAQQWGLETADGSIIGMPLENVSLAFHVFTVPKTGKLGAADWFRNVRPDMPWSGLIKLMHGFEGNNDACLRDVWRAAHYVGKPVTIPPLPPIMSATPPKVCISTTAGGMDGRHEFVRGEEVKIRVVADASLKVTDIRLELLQNGKILFSQTQPVANALFTVKTAPFADGDYALRATVRQGEQVVDTNTEAIGIRYLPPESFNFEVLYGAGPNAKRTDMEIADIHAAGMEVYTGKPDAAGLDALVRNHVGFSFRYGPDLSRVAGQVADFTKNPEYFRFGPDGKVMSAEGYGGGRPSPGISHPGARAAATQTIEQQVQAVAGLPSFRPYVLCNDDFSVYYGADYASHVLAAFKKDTGRDAPRAMIKPAKCGVDSGRSAVAAMVRVDTD